MNSKLDAKRFGQFSDRSTQSSSIKIRTLQVPWRWSKFFLLTLLLLPLWLQAQIRGVVTNGAGEPLVFVNVLINDSQRDGATTDLDGRFEIASSTPVSVLTFSYLGYEKLRVSAEDYDFSQPLQIELKSLAYAFETVEVIAGENPADRIMRRVVANRHQNNPEKLSSYTCRTYNKLHFAWLPQKEKLRKRVAARDSLGKKESRYLENVQKFSAKADTHHLFLMESITQRKYQRPAQYVEEVLHNKVSGFKEAEFVALAAEVQPFAFYQEQVTLFDKDFLNPVSPGSTKQYFFNLEDTLYRAQDTIFVLSYHPHKGKNFNGLKGILHIHSAGYAIENVKAEPAEDRKLNFLIEQHYIQLPDGQWFPEQLHFGMRWEQYPSPYLGIQASGRSFVSAVETAVGFPPKTFRAKESVIFTDEALATKDSIWQVSRPEALSPLEEATYTYMDTLGEKHHFDRWWRRGKALSDGRWPMGLLDLSLRRALAFNDFERVRLGAGLYTSDRLSKRFSIGGYGAYGIKDRAWKYGADLNIFLDKYKDRSLGFFYSKDIQEPGIIEFPLEPNLLTRRFFAQQMNEVEAWGASFKGELLPFLDIQLGWRRESWDKLLLADEEVAPVQFDPFSASILSLHLRYAYGQQYISFLGSKVPDEDPRYPVLSLSYEKGMRNLIEPGIDFEKWVASLRYRYRIRRVGETQWAFEAGQVTGEVPVPYLFYSNGIGRDFQWLSLDRVFQTMEQYEFLSNRFLHLFFRHDFGKLLIREKWFQPSIAVEHKLAVGEQKIPIPELNTFKTLEDPYLEAGLVVDNIIRVNYLNIAWLGVGVGAYYRYGAHHLPGGWSRNTAWRLSVMIDY